MAYPIVRHTVMPLLLRRLRILDLEHLPKTGPFIIAANHLSYLDAPFMASVLGRYRNCQVFFLAKLPVVKVFRPVGAETWMGMIPVDPANRALSLQPAIRRLNEGRAIGIFPEGTRNRIPDTLLRGKTGAARLAFATGAPVIPVGLKGPSSLSSFQALKIALFGGTELQMSIGQPIVFSRRELASKDEVIDATREIMRKIGELCGKSYPY